MGTLVLSLLSALLVIGILMLISKMVGSRPPGKEQIQKDLQSMREDVNNWAGDLVPLTKEELEVLSMSQLKQSNKKGFGTSAKGTFTSIFNEPLIAYSYKNYPGKTKNALLYARTANHEIAYRIKEEGISIVFDQKLMGTLLPDGELYSAGSKKLLAKIDRKKSEIQPVHIQDREVGSVVKALPAGGEDLLSKRALQFVSDDLAKEEKDLLVSLAVLELVDTQAID